VEHCAAEGKFHAGEGPARYDGVFNFIGAQSRSTEWDTGGK